MTEGKISHIRFGGFNAGSENWLPGQKMKPYMIQRLRELLKSMEGEKTKEENIEDMF